MEEKNRNSGEASSSRREGEGQLKKGYIAGKAPNKETDTEKLIYEFEQQKIELEKLKTELRKAQDSILAEKILLDSEKRFRTLIELSPCGIAIYQDGLFVYVNPSGLALIGAKVQQQLIGKPVLSIVHPDSKNAVIKRMRLVASGITVPAMEEKLVRLDGTTFEAEVIASLIIYNDRPAGQVIVRDISERKLAEESLHKLNLAINQSQEVILITDKEGIITYINPEFTNLYGYSAEEILGKVTPRILKSGLLSAEAYESFWKDLLKKKNVKAEYKNRRKDGSLIDIEGSADPILDEKGEIIGFLGIQRDITKRKQTEAELHEKETQFRNLADSGLALIWTSGTDKLCNYFNEPWLKFTGRTLEQEMGNGWTEGVHPDDLDRCVQTYVTAFDSHVKFDMEYRIRHVSGEYRWIRDLGTPNYNSSGEFIGYIGHCLDITKHKQAEVALHESQTLYHSFVESMPAGVFRKDSEGRFIFVNSAFCRLEGMKPDEILGRKPCDNLLRLETAGTPNMMTGQQKFSMLGEEHHELIMQTGKTIEIEEEYTKPDGTILYLHVVKSPVFSADGKVVGSQGVQFDVTGRKRAENAIKENEFALKEAQKLAHIGNWDYDVQSDKPKWSEETFKIFERDPAHGEPSWIEHKASIHPDDWDQVDQAIQKAIADGTPYEIEFRILKPDKNPKWAFTIGKADKDAN